jgi:hypothetical protein
MSQNQLSGGGFLRFGVYDYDYIGKNDFHGEAFLPLDAVEVSEELPKTQQLSLNLDKPSCDHEPLEGFRAEDLGQVCH